MPKLLLFLLHFVIIGLVLENCGVLGHGSGHP
jgi:hypothetical protein